MKFNKLRDDLKHMNQCKLNHKMNQIDILELIQQQEELEHDISLNLLEKNKFQAPTYQPDYFIIENNESKTSFLYRLFHNYEEYIYKFEVLSSDSFEDDSFEFVYCGDNPYFKNILNEREKKVESEILYAFYDNYKQQFPNENPFGNKFFTIFNFIQFVKSNYFILDKIGFIEGKTRFKKFWVWINKFSRRCHPSIINQINNEKVESNFTRSKSIEKILFDLVVTVQN